MKRLIKRAEKIYLKDILNPNDIETYGYNTDYGNRKFAISFINGNIYSGETHKDTVEEYLNSNDGNADDYLNRDEGFVTTEEQEDIDVPMAFASYISGIDNKDYIAIYPESLFNVDMNDFISVLKKKYPTAIICEDTNDRYMCQLDNIYLNTI